MMPAKEQRMPILLHRIPAERTRFRYFRSRCFAEGMSKALVSRSVGAGDGLSTEWRYVPINLPLGVLRGVSDAIFRGDIPDLARAGAILVGLSITAAGYLCGLTTVYRAARSPSVPCPDMGEETV